MISIIRPPQIIKKIFPDSLWQCWLNQDILFTFDDGPGPCTDLILDLSQKYKIKFAFFILPDQAETYPDTVKRIVADGHILGSHFIKHDNHIFYGKSNFLHSLNESIYRIEKISTNSVKYCRVPYGRLLPWQDKWIRKNKYQHVFWSLDSMDYKHEKKNNIISRVVDNVKKDDIILFHDGEHAHPEITRIIEGCIKLLNLT